MNDAAPHDPVESDAPARIWALIPCAGSGSRAAGAAPKQYQSIAGRPLVFHTLAAFEAVWRVARVFVVVAADDRFFDSHGDARRIILPCGGTSRAESVANGLRALAGHGARPDDWVLVHDAARCLVTPALIESLIDTCVGDAVGGLLAQPVADTLKHGNGERVVGTLDRARCWLAQTPQMFRLQALNSALQAAGSAVTDEASAMEAAGHAPLLVRGSALNFKVTWPEDFELAQAVLMARTSNPLPVERSSQENAGPPQVFLHPLGGPGASQGGGRSQENAGPPQVFLHPLGGPGASRGGGRS